MMRRNSEGGNTRPDGFDGELRMSEPFCGVIASASLLPGGNHKVRLFRFNEDWLGTSKHNNLWKCHPTWLGIRHSSSDQAG